MTKLDQIVQTAREMRCSDLHISEGGPILCRVDGALTAFPPADADGNMRELILSMLSSEQTQLLESGKDLDFSFTTSAGTRQRVNVFRQMGKLAATIRLLNDRIPTYSELLIPDVLLEMANQPRGLVLITGPTGSGKTTTLAAMIDYINSNRNDHIITIEDPVEYVYQSKQSLIHQREVGRDVPSFAYALRSALREDPDVILVGEMRDYETISAALTAAETGHLVLSTLHTTGVAQTLDRIIDACPAEAQNQTRLQLSGVLRGIVTQCLIPRASGKGRIVATEVLVSTDAALNTIREGRSYQLPSLMQASQNVGMHTLNNDLVRLCRMGEITKENALRYSNDKKDIRELMY